MKTNKMKQKTGVRVAKYGFENAEIIAVLEHQSK